MPDSLDVGNSIDKWRESCALYIEQHYDEILDKLELYFRHRNSEDPPELACEVLLRVFERVSIGAPFDYALIKFIFGVAKNVLREQGHHRKMFPLDDRWPASPNNDSDLILKDLLKLIPIKDAGILIEYYCGDRPAMLRRWRRPGQLRLKAHRVMLKLRRALDERPPYPSLKKRLE